MRSVRVLEASLSFAFFPPDSDCFRNIDLCLCCLQAPVNPMEFVTSVWGPTCDGLDQILKNAKLPELDVGEFINFPDMGAYTLCAGSTFNGMPRPDMFYHCSENIWWVLCGFFLRAPLVLSQTDALRLHILC